MSKQNVAIIDLNSESIQKNILSSIVEFPGSVEIHADKTNSEEVCFARYKEKLFIAHNLVDLCSTIRKHQNDLRLNSIAVSFALQSTTLPSPNTMIEGIYRLASGDRATVQKNKPWKIDISTNFKYFHRFSKEDQAPDNDRMLKLLVNAVEKSVPKNCDGVLFLSSGLDSTALALALAEADRRDIKCVTISPTIEGPEVGSAKQICQKLGLQHETVVLNQNAKDNYRYITEGLGRIPEPTADIGFMPYLIAVKMLGLENGYIIDGSGGDTYMGHFLGEWAQKKFHRTIRYSWIRNFIKHFVSFTSPYSHILYSPAEACLPRQHMWYAFSKKIYEDSTNASEYWNNFSSKFNVNTPSDLDTYFQGRDFTTSCVCAKGRRVADATGNTIAFPLTDHALCEYVFNMSSKDKFDAQKYVAKLPLRRLLDEKLEYGSFERRKFTFPIGANQFYKTNMARIREECLAAELWNSVEIEKFLGYLDSKRPSTLVPIFTIFMISAWINRIKIEY